MQGDKGKESVSGRDVQLAAAFCRVFRFELGIKRAERKKILMTPHFARFFSHGFL